MIFVTVAAVGCWAYITDIFKMIGYFNRKNLEQKVEDIKSLQNDPNSIANMILSLTLNLNPAKYVMIRLNENLMTHQGVFTIFVTNLTL